MAHPAQGLTNAYHLFFIFISFQVWSKGELLSAVVPCGKESLVTALREAGCPIQTIHLRALQDSYSPSLFDALLLAPEYTTCLLTERLIIELIARRSWSYLLRYVRSFSSFRFIFTFPPRRRETGSSSCKFLTFLGFLRNVASFELEPLSPGISRHFCVYFKQLQRRNVCFKEQ